MSESSRHDAGLPSNDFYFASVEEDSVRDGAAQVNVDVVLVQKSILDSLQIIDFDALDQHGQVQQSNGTPAPMLQESSSN